MQRPTVLLQQNLHLLCPCLAEIKLHCRKGFSLHHTALQGHWNFFISNTIREFSVIGAEHFNWYTRGAAAFAEDATRSAAAVSLSTPPYRCRCLFQRHRECALRKFRKEQGLKIARRFFLQAEMRENFKSPKKKKNLAAPPPEMMLAMSFFSQQDRSNRNWLWKLCLLASWCVYGSLFISILMGLFVRILRVEETIKHTTFIRNVTIKLKTFWKF